MPQRTGYVANRGYFMRCPNCTGRTRVGIVKDPYCTSYRGTQDDWLSFQRIEGSDSSHLRIVNAKNFSRYEPYMKLSKVRELNVELVCYECWSRENWEHIIANSSLWKCARCNLLKSSSVEGYESAKAPDDTQVRKICHDCLINHASKCVGCRKYTWGSQRCTSRAHVDRASRERVVRYLCVFCLDRLGHGRDSIFASCSVCGAYHYTRDDPLCAEQTMTISPSPSSGGAQVSGQWDQVYTAAVPPSFSSRPRGGRKTHFGKFNQFMQNYSYKPQPNIRRSTGEYFDTPVMGMEIEMGTKSDRCNELLTTIGNHYDTDWFYCKPDSSITGDPQVNNGVEMVSHPMSFTQWQQEFPKFKRLLRALIKSGARSYNTQSCGIHIHISRESWTKVQILKVHQLIHENVGFTRFLSQRSTDKLDQWSPIRGDKREWIAKARAHGGGDRGALNTYGEHTIEFRLFRGSLRPSTVFKNLEMVQAYYEFTKRYGMLDMSILKLLDFLVVERGRFPNLLNFLLKGSEKSAQLVRIPTVQRKLVEIREEIGKV